MTVKETLLIRDISDTLSEKILSMVKLFHAEYLENISNYGIIVNKT
jgi:hypothetical protein